MPTTNHNATPSASGWNFQYNAAIVIMLDNIEEALSIKVEGTVEDIEVRLSDGNRVFAQAKSTTHPMDAHNAIKSLSAALKTLSDANRSEEAKKLIFVTNRTNPFNEPETIQQFSNGYNYLPFSELWQPCQNQIRKCCQANDLDLPLDKLAVLVLYFSGNTDDRYKAIKERIRLFLSKLDLSNLGWTDKVFERWLRDFSDNAVETNHTKELSKEDMIWPLIVWLCGEEPERRLLEERYDDATVEAITQKYKTVINAKTERFEFVSKVMSGYAYFKTTHRDLIGRIAQERFIEEHSGDYSDEFDFSDIDQDVAKGVVEQTLRTILKQQFDIQRIKERVKL